MGIHPDTTVMEDFALKISYLSTYDHSPWRNAQIWLGSQLSISTWPLSPSYNWNGWQGIKHQVTYLLTHDPYLQGSHRHHRYSWMPFRDSTFLQSYKPPVYMNEEDEYSNEGLSTQWREHGFMDSFRDSYMDSNTGSDERMSSQDNSVSYCCSTSVPLI